jgi:CheY-like chemotaxis protein
MRQILIAEDDPRDEQLTVAALGEYNLANKISIVRDGEETLDYLYRRGKFKTRPAGDPAVVLLDLKMPKVNGLDVLKIIKSDPQLKTIPIVVLTSSREEPDLIECYKLGVNAYVVKPVDFAEFMKAVKLLGVFWVAVNEPPALAGTKSVSLPSDEFISPRKKQSANEISAPHPASGR